MCFNSQFFVPAVALPPVEAICFELEFGLSRNAKPQQNETAYAISL
jgi:hypothetical protein